MNAAGSLVLFHSDHELVERTIQSVAALRPPLQSLWVHVNDATPSEVEWVESMLRIQVGIGARVTQSTVNLGFAQAHNRALDSIFANKNDYALVLNPDLVLPIDAIASFVASDPKASRVTGPLLELADPYSLLPEGRIDSAGIRWTATGRHLDLLQGKPLLQAPTNPRRVEGVSGACMFVGRNAYARVVDGSGEFFDEAFIAYREDAELGLRARRLGVECWLLPTVRVLHVRRARGTKRGENPHIDKLSARNRFLLAFKYGLRRPGLPPLVLIRDVLVLLGVLLRERSSLAGLQEAWQLRHDMRVKGRRVRATTGHQK